MSMKFLCLQVPTIARLDLPQSAGWCGEGVGWDGFVSKHKMTFLCHSMIPYAGGFFLQENESRLLFDAASSFLPP